MNENPYIQDISVLVLTPTGRDGELVCDFLKQAGLHPVVCRSLDELTDQIELEQGPAVIAEEALGDDKQTQRFLKALATQPAWSDVPLLVIRTRQSQSSFIPKLTAYFNCTIQRRPIHLPAFISSVQSAVQARQRQLEVKKKNELLHEARRYAESIIETIEEAVLVLDGDLKVISANQPFYNIFDNISNPVIGRYVYELADGRWQVPEFRSLLEHVLPEQKAMENFEIQYPAKNRTVHLLLNARQLTQDGNGQPHILLAFYDITSHKLHEQELKDLTEQLLMAEEQQRQQIAVDLHDSIGQLLAFSKREITTLLKEPAFENKEQLLKVRDLLTESIRQSRKLTNDLSSPTLHTFGLQAGIEELLEQFAHEHNLTYRFHPTDRPLPLQKRTQLLLYRSVKELLSNIGQHANAGHIGIEISADDEIAEVIVTDDGKGFDTALLNQNGQKGFSLHHIRQRLTNLKGTFQIQSESGQGTTVTLQAPLKRISHKQGKIK